MKTLLIAAMAALVITGCKEEGNPTDSTTAASGVHGATVSVPTGSDGLTVEQRNVKERLLVDNKPGAIKHLYVISAYSGQVHPLFHSEREGHVKRQAAASAYANGCRRIRRKLQRYDGRKNRRSAGRRRHLWLLGGLPILVGLQGRVPSDLPAGWVHHPSQRPADSRQERNYQRGD